MLKLHCLYHFKYYIYVSLIINEAIKNNLDMLGVFIMLSERMGHTIEVMQQVYMYLFPNIQNKVVDIINDLNKQDQNKTKKTKTLIK